MLALIRASGISIPSEAHDFEIRLLQPGRNGKAVGAWSWVLMAQLGNDEGTKSELWGCPDTVGETLRIGRLVRAEGSLASATLYVDA